MKSFRKVKFEMRKLSGYGQYLIIGFYRGKEVRVRSTNSEAWDWWNDESDKAMHQNAKRYCYTRIITA